MNLFLTKENLWSKYEAAKDWSQKWSENFEEYDRIARNEAPNNVPEQYARVSDGTAAALVRKAPKRVIQQLPTGIVTSDDEDDPMAIVAEFILLHKILPDAKGGHDLIQKFWSAIENGLTFGGQAVYTPFVWNGSEFTADAKLIYYGDIFFQPGKTSFYDCDYFFIRSWWQPETIDQIVEREQKLREKAKSDGTKYTPTWDISALKELKKQVESKDKEGTTESEQRAGVTPEGIEIVTGFQKGKGAIFLMGNPSTKKIVRQKKNRDPRGLPPVNYFYADVDNSNPFGRSVMSLIGGIQNMIDANMRAYMFNRALELAPPMKVRGGVDTSQAIYEPNAYIELPDNADISPLDVTTTAIRDYASIYSLNKTQILNLFNSGGDTSVSADVGNPGFGKTPTALKQQKQILDADDNYLRKNFESFFEDWAETAINVYFAEREGVEELQLDQKTADRLRELAKRGKLPEGYVREDNKVSIDYSEAANALHFHVDASTSKLNGQAEQLESLQLILDFISSPAVTQLIPQEKIVLLYNSIVSNSGVLEPDKLKIDPKMLEGGETDSVSMDTQAQEVAQELLQRGWPEELINWAIHSITVEGKDPSDVCAQAERILGNGR